jgi:hypothetical protein
MTATSRPLAALGFVAAILLPVSLNAQVMFERTYGTFGDEYAYAAEQTPDGGYIVCGMADSNETGHHTFLLKTDSLGDSLWMRYYGVPGELSEARCMAQAPDGGYVAAGMMNGSGYVVRMNQDGDSLWAQVGGSMFYSIEPTRDSGFICAGCTRPGGSWADLFLLKLGANGETLWTRTYSGNLGDQANAVRQTADGGYIVAGATTSGGGNPQLWLLRTDAGGDTLWTRKFDGNSGQSVRQTSDGGFIVAGWTGDNEAADALLIKTDGDGALMWRQTFGGSQGDYLQSVLQIGDGGYVAGGTSDSYGSAGRIFVARTDGAGNLLWDRALGGSRLDYATTLARTRDSGFVLCCTRYPGHGQTDFDILLIKTDSLGRTAVEEPRKLDASRFTLDAKPNPCRERTAISFQLTANSSAQLSLFDASGRLVLSQPVRTSPFPLSTSSLPSGTYFALLDFGSRHASIRLVVQR